MKPIIDHRTGRLDEPGFHALIAGVSAYPHLLEGSRTEATDTFGMKQLSSAALSAYKMYRWLEKWQDKLSVPLATCWLLLSPAASEVEKLEEPFLKNLAEDEKIATCTWDNFESAAKAWREGTNKHKDNIVFFYFVGHGIQDETENEVLLMEDFGDGVAGIFHRAVSLENIITGMAPNGLQENISRKQLYFVDACRKHPSELIKYTNPRPPEVFTPVKSTIKDDRSVADFYATVPRDIARAVPEEQTLFGKALITCLEGGGADCKEMDGQDRWYVSCRSLSEKLNLYMPDVQKPSSAKAMPEDIIIHFLDGPPLVDIALKVDPPEAHVYTMVEFLEADETKVAVIDGSSNRISDLPIPLKPHPFLCQLEAGTYNVRGTIIRKVRGKIIRSKSRSQNYYKFWTLKTPSHTGIVKVKP